MERKPFDFVIIAVEIMVVVLILGFTGRMLDLGKSATDLYQAELETARMMEQYAIYNKYDGTTLSGSDVVEALYVHAGSDFCVVLPSLRVTTQRDILGGTNFSSSSIATWLGTNTSWVSTGGTVNTLDLTTMDLATVVADYVDISSTYTAVLITHTNGHVVGLEFSR